MDRKLLFWPWSTGFVLNTLCPSLNILSKSLSRTFNFPLFSIQWSQKSSSSEFTSEGYTAGNKYGCKHIFLAFKKFPIIKYFWHYEVKQTPQLLKIVAERSPSHQQFESGIKVVKSGKILTLEIFDFMSLVHHQHLPSYPWQRINTSLDPFISGDHNVEFSGFYYSLLFWPRVIGSAIKFWQC